MNAPIASDATKPVTTVPMNPEIAWTRGVLILAAASTAARISSPLFPAARRISACFASSSRTHSGNATVVKRNDEPMTITPATTEMSVPSPTRSQ